MYDKKGRLNLNTCVIGGSGARKSRAFVKTNMAQAQGKTSMVILDPKGENLRDIGWLLEENGYKIRVLDLIRMERSEGYNPFAYLHTENDVQRLATNLFKATTPKDSHPQEPFWDDAAAALLKALIFYVREMCEPEEQNFASVMQMLRLCDAPTNEDDPEMNPVDYCFARLEQRDPTNAGLGYYSDFRKGAAKTGQSIKQVLLSRLDKFNLSSVRKLTSRDELELERLGEEKTALFALIPDSDTSFNFLVSILYTQLFQQLLTSADFDHGGKLPVPVHFLMDEFANVSLPDDFDKIVSVIRSRGVFVSIILQNLSQLKALFEKQWESIIGNCDTLVYLGGNEQSTHEYISKALGKETIATNSYGRTKGMHGSYSVNDQQQARDLMTPDEVRMLDEEYAIVLGKGKKPVVDRKYDITMHPLVKLTTYGGAPEYVHGRRELPNSSSVTLISSEEIPPGVRVWTIDDFPNEEDELPEEKAS
jgi:type IV secretion system protein VirD4